MTNLATRQRYWTVDDLDELPDDDGLRYEIIDGELFVSKNPDWEHQWVMTTLVNKLNDWSLPRKAGKAGALPSLLFGRGSNVIPDAVWISTERERQIRRGSKFYGAPEIVVEVLSPGPKNAQRDRLQKLRLYEAQGVQEYGIIDWRTRQMAVYELDAGQLQLRATLSAEADLTSPLLPGFRCQVGDLFEPK